jgi:hypothetical protein
MDHLTDRKIATMRQRAEDAQTQAAERERRETVAAAWASPIGRFVTDVCESLAKAVFGAPGPLN